MALRLPTPVILRMLVGLAILFSTFAHAQGTSTAQVGDPDRGKVVYQKIGYCANCHGWAGDGRAGANPMAHGVGINLRETALDAEGLAEVIKCGRPGTQMPYHDSVAYRDDRCYGLVLADLQQGEVPVRGKTFRDKDVSHMIAYLQQYLIGLGKPTLEECALYYGASADTACAYLRSE